MSKMPSQFHRRPAMLPVLLLSALALMLVVAPSAAPSPTSAMGLDAARTRASETVFTAASDKGAARYIVQLTEPPLATYRGGLPGLPATSPGAPDAGDASESQSRGLDAGVVDDGTLGRINGRFDGSSPAAVAYSAHLDAQHASLETALAAIAPAARVTNHYRVAFNGLSVHMTPAQAETALELPGVIAVTRETPFQPLMDVSLEIIGADTLWDDPRIGGRAETGRGTRIAIIDSGISAEHPMFDDAGFTAPTGFPKSTLSVGDTVYEYSPEDLARFTNSKVIAARAYANPETVDLSGEVDPREQITPLADGLAGFHGAHVAGIAAGSSVSGAPGDPGVGTLSLSGVAPGAYLMAYKFTNAYTPEILEMIDDAVADGADVINASWGTSAMNVLKAEHHPVAQAFKAAHAAGVVVVAAAGNSGENGEATLGGPHQMIDEVITVANSRTGRSFAYRLTASEPGLTDTLRSHPVVYESFGTPFTVIEKRAFHTDMCNILELGLRGRTRVIISPFEGTCEDSLLPIPLPAEFGFVTKLLNAATVRAESVVFYAAEGDLETLAATLGLIQLIAPLLEGVLGDLTLPVTAIIAGDEAVALGDYATTHSELVLRLDSTPLSLLDPDAIDAAHPTSSQGPAPVGPLKPDLGAPGTDILSVSTGLDGTPAGYTTATGTSMASPHVAGAAAVLRQLHPEWTPSDIRSALLITADPELTVEGELAPTTVQGAGRLDLAQAADTALLIHPPTIELDRAEGETERRAAVRISNAGSADGGGVETRDLPINHEPGTGGGVPIPALPASVRIEGDGSPLALELAFDITGLTPGDYDGRIAFGEGEEAIRVTYHLRVPQPELDVLLLDVLRRSAEGAGGGIPGFPGIPGLPGLPGGGGFEDGPDHIEYWVDALDALDLQYDVWTVAEDEHAGAPPLSELQRYRMVILAAGDGDAPLDRLPGGMTSLQMYLLQGGRLLVSGHDTDHDLLSASDLQSSGAMVFLSRYFSGFERLEDDADDATVLRPTRLFDGRIELATSESAEAAGNGGAVDLGRPLLEVVTSAPDGGGGGIVLPPDIGLAAPLVVDRILPFARTFVVVDEGSGGGGGSGDAEPRSAMIGVSNDASLEHPRLDSGIPWRAMFAGFGIESIRPAPGALNRAQVLERLWEWSDEPEDVSVTLFGPRSAEMGEPAEVRAFADSESGVEIIGWRWDAGDGRPFITAASSRIELVYDRPGEFIVRAEAMTAASHTVVGETRVLVEGGMIYLPRAERP